MTECNDVRRSATRLLGPAPFCCQDFGFPYTRTPLPEPASRRPMVSVYGSRSVCVNAQLKMTNRSR